VASAVAADPKLIAAAQTANGAPGDNRNALALVNLRDNAIAALGNTTVSGYFLSFLGSLGEQAQASQNSVDFQNQLLTQVQARRDGTSGVSIDEEMTNLILFQRAFEASSRLVTTSNELYQTLIDMTR
jgi:flagellar hook-associated protein 1 FlgK